MSVAILVFHLSLSVSNPKRQKGIEYFPSTNFFHGCNLPITIFFQGQRQAVLGSFYHSVTSAPILPVQVSQTNRSRNSRQRPLRKSPQRLKGVCAKMCVWEPSFIRWQMAETLGISLKLWGFPETKIFGVVFLATIIWPDDWYGNEYIHSLGTNSHPLQRHFWKRFSCLNMLVPWRVTTKIGNNLPLFWFLTEQKYVDKEKRDYYFGCSPVTATTRTIARVFCSWENTSHLLWISLNGEFFFKHWSQRNSQEGDLAANARLLKDTFWDHSHNFQKTKRSFTFFAAKKHDDMMMIWKMIWIPVAFQRSFVQNCWGLCFKRRDKWSEIESVSRRTGKWLSNMESFLAKHCRFIYEHCLKNVSDIPLLYLVNDFVLKMAYEKMIPQITEQYHHSLV